jgi:hypothetical protein
MDPHTLHGLLKVVALVVLLLMLVTLLYTGYVSVTHWSGIGV